MKKIKTGIPGLDPLIGGGIPPDSVVLLSGCAGTGKTIMSLQFLAHGCHQGDRALYLSFEEREDKIRNQASQFGWDFSSLERRKLLKIKAIAGLSLGTVFSDIEAAIEEFKPRRMVIDSATYFVLAAHARTRLTDLKKVQTDEQIYGAAIDVTTPMGWDGLVVRKIMIDLVKLLQSKGICTILTSEVGRNSDWYSRDTLSEFACDGVVLLKSTSIGNELHRTMEIVKMRNTIIKGGLYNFDFFKDGIKIIG